LPQTWAISRGVIENEPCPVSEFDSTNPANTSGLSAPRAPVNGET
jgi:hypothetical protein